MEARFEDRNEKLPLFARLGGRVFIILIAEKFCDRLLVDQKLSELLELADPDELKQSVIEGAIKFLTETDNATTLLEQIGQRFPLSLSQFNRCVSNLIAALVWAGVTRELIEEVLDLVTPLSQQLVPLDDYPFKPGV